jgi:cytidylate kinase
LLTARSEMADLVITIDGPAASGKSTVARLLANKLDASFLDTGAMYRAVTLAAMEAGVDLKDERKLLEIVRRSEFQFSVEAGRTIVCIDNVDVTERIREPEITANARHIAGAPEVRDELVQMQRQYAADSHRVVTEGRDQGTVAFADADVKFFLTAEAGERARRRQADLEDKGSNQSLEQIQRAIEERDRSDESRAVGPLKPADDAVVVDTTDLSIGQVVEKLLLLVKKRCSESN